MFTTWINQENYRLVYEIIWLKTKYFFYFKFHLIFQIPINFIKNILILFLMRTALLMLDGMDAPVGIMSELLGREITWVENIKEAKGELKDNSDKYAAFIVEPAIYLNRLPDVVWGLQRLMTAAKKEMPVIVYSTQEQEVIDNEFCLQGMYNTYVSKNVGSPKKFMTALEQLI